MPLSSLPAPVTSSQQRLEEAVFALDEKMGALDEWLDRVDATFDDFQLRWQVSSDNLSAQLLQVERELAEPPRLRIY